MGWIFCRHPWHFSFSKVTSFRSSTDYLHLTWTNYMLSTFLFIAEMGQRSYCLGLWISIYKLILLGELDSAAVLSIVMAGGLWAVWFSSDGVDQFLMDGSGENSFLSLCDMDCPVIIGWFSLEWHDAANRGQIAADTDPLTKSFFWWISFN